MKYITVKLTEDQLDATIKALSHSIRLRDELTAYWKEFGGETGERQLKRLAFDKRVLNKLRAYRLSLYYNS